MENHEKNLDTIQITNMSTHDYISSFDDFITEIKPLDLSAITMNPLQLGSLTGTVIGSGQSNQSVNIAPPVWTTNNTGPFITNYPNITLSDPINKTLHVEGDSEFKGKVTIQGRNIVEILDSIEQRLGILRPNADLESKWDQLRELREQYVALEKELNEKQKAWDLLQKKG